MDFYLPGVLDWVLQNGTWMEWNWNCLACLVDRGGIRLVLVAIGIGQLLEGT